MEKQMVSDISFHPLKNRKLTSYQIQKSRFSQPDTRKKDNISIITIDNYIPGGERNF